MAISTYTVPDGRVVHSTKVDFVKRIIQNPINVVQYDKSLPIIEVELFSNGYSYVLPSNADMNIRFGKKDHTFVIKPVLGCDADRKKVYFEFDEQMSYFHGQYDPILELKIGGVLAGSQSIRFNIDRNPVQITDVESHSEYPDLEEAVQEAQDAADRAEEAAASVESYADDSEAWARGTRGGEPVSSTDPTYQNNSKWYSEKSAESAEESALNAEGLIDGRLVAKKAEHATQADEADFANNLTPYDDESGVTQDKAFILEGTGTNNGEDVADVGDIAEVLIKKGNVIAYNQLAKSVSSTTDKGITYTNNGDGTYTVNGTASDTSVLTITDYIQLNHYYFYCLQGAINSVLEISGYTATRKNVPTILYNNLATQPFAIRVPATQTANNEIVKPIIVDLTQWFGSNEKIPAYLLAHPEAFGRYYRGSLTYNTGVLKPADGRYIKSIGRQVWPEDWEVGGINSNGEFVSYNAIRSKNYIEVTPNTDYYIQIPSNSVFVFFYDINKNFISALGEKFVYSDRVFKIPSNCHFIAFQMSGNYGTTYNHDITISIYYPGESGYDQYYPYEVFDYVDTGDEELLSAGSVADTKVPSGLITHNVGTYVFTGNENWVKSDHCYIMRNSLPSAKLPTDSTYYWNANIVFAKLATSNWQSLSDGTVASGIALTFNEGKVVISENDYANISSFIGKTINYELATPITEQGTPYKENINVHDFGSLGWYDSDDELIEVPQGNTLVYQVAYKAFLDTLHKRAEGDAGSVVLESELSASETARDSVDVQLKNAIGGTLRQLLASSQSVDFENTKYIDVGEVANSTISNYRFNLVTDAKPASTLSSTAKAISTVLKQATGNTYPYNNPCFYVDTSGYIVAHDTSCSNLEDFKAKYKGVLLAYEKASS